MKRLVRSGIAAALLLMTAGCADEVDSTYSSYSASFNFTPVTGVPTLYRAVNNAGQFCSIRRQNTNYIFSDADGNSQTYPITATDVYNTWICISGFIVGTTNIPDISTGQLTLVAFDLVCPNCFNESTIQRRLEFDGDGVVSCGRCDRSYDLNNFGIVSSDGGGKSLERYRVYYSSDRLIIQN